MQAGTLGTGLSRGKCNQGGGKDLPSGPGIAQPAETAGAQ